jgi:GDPmannose 4,6-dehydratase
LKRYVFSTGPFVLYSAGSSECFGDTEGHAANEQTPFRPRSPYAVAKSTAHWLVANYRAAYELHASTGILFNHESPLRPERFVTKKIVAAAVRIAEGERSRLTPGNIHIKRDWRWGTRICRRDVADAAAVRRLRLRDRHR